jgi:hypothetical protein
MGAVSATGSPVALKSFREQNLSLSHNGEGMQIGGWSTDLRIEQVLTSFKEAPCRIGLKARHWNIVLERRCRR